MNTEGITGHNHQIVRMKHMLANGTLPQAMLFYGTPGIGKKKLALRLLNSLFCKNPGPPCLKCPICLQFKAGTYPDFFALYPNDKGIIPIGNQEKKEQGSVRWLINCLSKSSLLGKYGVIIDGIDKISNEGEVALLKTIEEPPPGTHIILISANKSKILPTILSRCMKIPFSPLTDTEIKKILQEDNITISNQANQEIISKISAGSIETAIILSNEEILEDILNLCVEISEYVNFNSPLTLDIHKIQKNIPIDTLITILIYIYRTILFSIIKKLENHTLFENIAFNDTKKLRKLIKIFLALRKGLSNNLNIKSSLKGMLYSMNNIHETDLQGFDLSQGV